MRRTIMTTHNADHTQRRPAPAGVACLNVGLGELGAGGLLGSTSAGVGDGSPIERLSRGKSDFTVRLLVPLLNVCWPWQSRND